MPKERTTIRAADLTWEAVFGRPYPHELAALVREALGTPRPPTAEEWEAVPLKERARLVKRRAAEVAAAIRDQEARNAATEAQLRRPAPETPTTTAPHDDGPWRF